MDREESDRIIIYTWSLRAIHIDHGQPERSSRFKSATPDRARSKTPLETVVVYETY